MKLDHLAIVAETLDEGVAWAEERFGVSLSDGGTHEAFGTHNKLLHLGTRLYLEVIAPKPNTTSHMGERWFGLDDYRGPPKLSTWLVRSDDVRGLLVDAVPGSGQAIPMNRGNWSWLIAVPDSGWMPLDGMAPGHLQWGSSDHPADHLPDQGVRLLDLTVSHPQISQLARYAQPRLSLLEGTPNLSARFSTPNGQVTL